MLSEDVVARVLDGRATTLPEVPLVRDRRVYHHSRPNRHRLRARANGIDRSRHVGASDVRHRRLDRQTAAHPKVQVIHRRGFDLDANLTWAGLGNRDLADLDHLGTAVLCEEGGSHLSRHW